MKSQDPIVQLLAFMDDEGYTPTQEISGRKEEVEDLFERIRRELVGVRLWRSDFSIFQEAYGHLFEFLENGKKLQILMNVNKFSLDNAAGLMRLKKKFPNLEVRHFESEFKGEIYDETNARLLVKSPKTPIPRPSHGKLGPLDKYEYHVWMIESPIWISFLNELWKLCWEDANQNVNALINRYANL